MTKIEVTEEVKLLLDNYIDEHNRSIDEYPNSVMAIVGKRTYSDIIRWWYSETFNRPISSKEATELGL